MNKKVYLGDAVYAQVEHGMIKLTTEDGVKATNTIYMEFDVVENLIEYYAKVTEPAKEEDVQQ